ncbi:tetratricopeptide repeat protein [Winogradskyella sp. DF17]|uniref:Tetratricopeptide repeat protein n=1 Tax=Winogradskyella pelagia TaxID=2819984 RepID=A0ABS3T092_9FLAO|nr:tetratricopeptide repeat protein [Winogradskyella sp. DF17]MBO3116159.1 tetratricopeptide repeat protein [Winogradskyella sp. DF17]
MSLYKYWRELKRRNVIKAGIAYLVVAWLITQVLSIVFPAFDVPPYFLKAALILLLIGFPIWLVFSWIYELTPDGIKKTEDIPPSSSLTSQTGNKLNKLIIFTLTLAIIVLIYDRFSNKPVNVVDYGDKSIAVMAFADMSPLKDHEYFSDGISEELLNILARIKDLKVISRTSSFSYKDKNATATEIGKDLDVSYILEGSIRKAGNTVRITTQLINTKDGSHVWSNTYDRTLDSIFKIQDDIAQEVSNQLESSLLGKRPNLYKPKVEAYNLYLQARHFTNQNTKEGYITAEDLINQSLAIDSSYAEAWDALAHIHNNGVYNFNIGNSAEKIYQGIEAAEKALQLNPDLAEAYTTLGSLQNKVWRFEESLKNMNIAVELQPNNAVILGTAALYTLGDLEKSVALIQQAIANDPLIYTNYFNLGFTYYRLGKLDKALSAFNTYSKYYPNSQILHYMKSIVYLAQNKTEKALEEIKQETHPFFSLYGRNYIYFAIGETAKADKLFEEFLEKESETDPANVADLYAFRGNHDKAFEFLEKAVAIKDPVLLEVLTYPASRTMSNDPRWKNLIKKINLPRAHKF